MSLNDKLDQAKKDMAAIQEHINQLEKQIEDEKFKPFDITIHIENEDQADKVFCVFNRVSLLNFMGLSNRGYDIRRCIEKGVGHPINYYSNGWAELNNLMKC